MKRVTEIRRYGVTRLLGYSVTQLRSYSVTLLLVALVGCSQGDVPDERLVATYADVIIVRESSNDSVLVQKKLDSVLASHNYAREEFEKELRSMGTTPKLFKNFYDSVNQRLSRMRDTTSP